MTFFKRSKRYPSGRFASRRILRVLLAAVDPAALAALAQFESAVERVEAFTTGGAYRLVKGSNLAILDPQSLSETDGISCEGLLSILNQSGIAWCSPVEFAASPGEWEQRALAAIGAIDALPPKAIAFASYSGGVGKTTLSLDLARFIAGKDARLPAAVVELKHGKSSLRALLAADAPHIYEIITQGAAPAKWQGVTLVPMEFQTARLLLGRQADLSAYLEQVKRDHVLTVFDLEPDSEFLPLVAPLLDECYGLAVPRADALENATQALGDVREMRKGGTPSALLSTAGHCLRAGLIVNQCRGLADVAALAGVERLADLPYLDRVNRYDGRLARHMMRVVYPGWK